MTGFNLIMKHKINKMKIGDVFMCKNGLVAYIDRSFDNGSFSATIKRQDGKICFDSNGRAITAEFDKNGLCAIDLFNVAKFEVGMTVEFNHGLNRDMRSHFKIIKIDKDGIYLDWDCFWFPIQDEPSRNIKIIEVPTS